MAEKNEIKNTQVKETKTSTKPKAPSKAEIEKKNKELEAKLAKLEKLLEEKETVKEDVKEPIKKVSDLKVDKDKGSKIKIDQNELITVMSLYNGELSLSTKGMGQGEIYDFVEFGEELSIPYSDLSKIISREKGFHKKGFFYIANKDVIKKHNLERMYNNFVASDDILDILEFDDETIENLYENSPEGIKDTIVSIVVEKIKDGEDMDANKVNLLSRLYGHNVEEIAQDAIKNKKDN